MSFDESRLESLDKRKIFTLTVNNYLGIENEMESDVVIIFAGQKFVCHKVILEKYSEYFKTMFRSPLAESSTSEIKLYGLNTEDFLKSETISLMLTFFYSEDIELHEDTVLDTLLTADYFGVKRLMTYCIGYLDVSLTSKIWIKTFRLSKALRIKHLTEICMSSFFGLHQDVDMEEISYGELYSILCHKNEASHRNVLGAAMAWVQCNIAQRKQYLDTLLVLSDFEQISSHFLKTNILPLGFIQEREDVVKKITKAIQLRHLFIIGGTGRLISSSLVKYYPMDNVSIECAQAPYPFFSRSFAYNRNGKLYVLRCWGRSDLQIYDPTTDTWKVRKDVLTTRRWSASAAIVGDRIFLVDGSGQHHAISGVESINVIDNDDDPLESYIHSTDPSWTPLKRKGHSVVAHKSDIYILGGKDGDDCFLKTCEVFDTVKNTRSMIESLHEKRNALSAVLFQNTIVAIGGHDGQEKLSSVEQYSFKTKKWSFFPPMTTARVLHCSCVFDEKIYVVGGTIRNTMEFYNPDTLQWTFHTYLPVERFGSVLAPCQSDMNAIISNAKSIFQKSLTV